MERSGSVAQSTPKPAAWHIVSTLLVILAIVGSFFSSVIVAEAADTVSVVVKLVGGLTPDEQAAVIARDGGVETSSIPALRLHVITVPMSELPLTLQNYQSDAKVESVELNKSRKAEGAIVDPNYGVQWALSKIGWNSVFGTVIPAPGSIAKLAILDTGIDASHPDLAGNVISGTSILDGSNGLSDPNGHGTSLAGIAAAQTDNGIGIAGIGYAGVRIMPVTVLGANGLGQDSDIISGIIWAADHGANVILMGFSNPDFSQNLQDAIDYAWNKGAVLVAATGNDGVSTPTFPAGDRGVVGVSATDESDFLFAGSNYGLDTFLAAPGANIYTTGLGNTYAYISGTSASSAVVAGVAAFMKAVDSSLTNGVIVGRLAKSADAIGTAGDTNNQTMFGNGRVNMANAIADTSTDSVKPAGADPVGSGGPYVGPYTAASKNFTITFAGKGGGSIAFSEFTQPEAACTGPSTCSRLLANSDSGNLTVTPDSGSVFSGWTGSFDSTKGGSTDCSGTKTPCTISMGEKAQLLTATFNLQSTPTTTGVNPANKAVGDPEFLLTVNGTGFVSEAIVKFNGVGLTTTFVSSTQVRATVLSSNLSAAGTFGVTVVNPDGGTSNSQTFTVEKGTPTITWTNPADITYGAVLSDTQLNATATVAGRFTYDQAAGLKLNAGSAQTLSVTFYPTDTVNYNTATKSVIINVNKTTLTVTAEAKSKLYGATDPALTYAISGLIGGDAVSGALARTAGENVGTYAIDKGTLTASTNYSIAFTGANLTITPATLTVTAEAKSKVYGAAEPALTYAISGLVGSDTVSGALARTAGENVGTYAIDKGTLTASTNYSIAFTGANLTITPATLTVTAEAKSKVYGAAEPALTYAISGLVGSDTVTGTLARAAGTDVGTYAIDKGTLTASTNYIIAFTGANLTISKAAQTITFTPLANKTDNDAPFTVSATASSTLTVSFSAAGNCSVSGSFVTINGAGTCTVTAMQGGDTNHNAASNVLQSFTISASGATVSPGTNVLVTPTSEVQLTFSSVLSGGSVTATAISNPAAPTANFKLSGSAYEITNTAGFAGQVTVCINYNPANLFNPANASKLKLWHYNGSIWQNITFGPVDTTAHKVCGLTSTFSPFAVVEPTAYTITATADAHGSIVPSGLVKVDSGAGKTFTISTDQGYDVQYVVVDGINLGALTSYTFNNVTADHTISAIFTVKTFTITASAGSNGTVTPAGVSSVNYGTNKLYTITPAAGFHVETLTVDSQQVTAATSYTFPNVTGPHSIAATFAENPHAIITATAGANGSISQASADVPAGTSPIFTFSANSGYRVGSVVVDGTPVGAPASYTFSNVTAGTHTISVSFILDQFTITASVAGNGSITPSGTVTRGGSKVFTISADQGYDVQYVVVDGINLGALTSYTFNNVTADHTISAIFTVKTFTITASAGSNGTVTPAGVSSVNYGTNKLYTITPAAGFHVETLTVDSQQVTAATSYTFPNVTGPHSIAATFAENPHAIITATAGANGSISQASADVPAGTSPIFTFSANSGYRVGSVVVDGTPVGAPASYTFSNVTAGTHTISVSFILDQFTITASVAGNGSITPSGTVTRGGSKVFTISADQGYDVQYVVVDGINLGALTSYTFNNVTADHTISAIFTVKTFTITASAGSNGTVTPAGVSSVNYGTNKLYTITPAAGFHVETLTVDSQQVTAATSYTFPNVTGPHSIAATFAENPHAIITATAGANGSISQASADVPAGTSPIFTFSANSGYRVGSVVVDGTPVGAPASYTFSNVTAGTHTISVSFILDQFTITASVAGNGSITPSGTVTRGGSKVFTISADQGYDVQYVVVDGINLGALTSYTFNNVTADHTISAIFTVKTFTITASAGSNGTVTPAGVSSVNYGTNKLYTITPAAGFHVETLTVDSQQVTAATSYTFPNVTGPHSIAATFAENPHAIITATAGANGSISQASADVPAGTSPIFTFSANSGYRVGSVVVDGTPVGAPASYTFSNVTAGTHTISVSFILDQFTITASVAGNGSITPSGTVTRGGSKVFTISADQGYDVQYVVVDGINLGALTSYTFNNVTADHTISAIFTVKTFTITASAGSNGTVTPAGVSSVNYGTNKLYTITPAAGFHVETLTVDSQQVTAATSYTFPNVTGPHSIAATFAENPHAIITATAGANGSISQASADVPAGTSPIFTFSANSGYRVGSVVVDGTPVGAPASYTFSNVTAGTHTISVSFISNSSFTITATADANGTITPPGTISVNNGGTQTYTISASANYRISYVLVNGVNKGAINTYTFSNVQANQTISAAFTPITYAITVTQSPNGTISPSTNNSVPQGVTKIYTITPVLGYHVETLTVDGVQVTTATSYTFSNIQANHTITATFAPNPSYNITASAGAGGSISPVGITPVLGGLYKVYTITPEAGYRVDKVLVDGVNKGKINSYIFYSVFESHTIIVSFVSL